MMNLGSDAYSPFYVRALTTPYTWERVDADSRESANALATSFIDAGALEVETIKRHASKPYVLVDLYVRPSNRVHVCR